LSVEKKEPTKTIEKTTKTVTPAKSIKKINFDLEMSEDL